MLPSRFIAKTVTILAVLATPLVSHAGKRCRQGDSRCVRQFSARGSAPSKRARQRPKRKAQPLRTVRRTRAPDERRAKEQRRRDEHQRAKREADQRRRAQRTP